MSEAGHSEDRDAAAHKIKRAAIVFGLSLCAATIFVLSSDVRRKIDELASASSDRAQWTLSQVEVEVLAFNSAVMAARGDGGSLDDVRVRFDLLYSRFVTLSRGRLYETLRTSDEVAAGLASFESFLEDAIPYIDGDDVALQAALPSLGAQTTEIRQTVRTIALRGNDLVSSNSERQRRGVSATLVRIAGLTGLLVIALLLLVFALMRLNRIAQAQAKEMTQSSSRLAAIVGTSLDAILVIDRKGRVIDFNGAAERIFGFTRDEAIGADMGALVVPDHLRAAHDAGMRRYRTKGEKRFTGRGLRQMEARRKDGTVFPVELSVSTAKSADGEVFVSYIRDISARVAAEKELIDARDRAVAGERAKAGLLAVMSHEMRTPLNGILGTLELLSDTPLERNQRRYLEIIESSGKLLLHHVNDVLDISRLDAGKGEFTRESFGLEALIEEVVEGQRAVAEAKGNTLAIDCGELSGHILVGDPIRLRQVLLNLVGNAIKFTQNGRIGITAVRLRGLGEFEIRVSDTGVGIGPEDQTKIFDDFVTLDTSYVRSAGGTGLGLAIVRRLVQGMGGTIGVQSTPGEGSLFWIRLPLNSQASSTGPDSCPAPTPAAPAAVAVPSLRVLVVEDNSVNRRVAREMLEKDGHTVSEAHNGKEGVARAETEPFDLILMDISMPEMDGVAATQAIRSGSGVNRGTPIVALTAHAQPSELARFGAAGMTDTITKPVSRAVLRRLVDGTQLPVGDHPAEEEASARELIDTTALAALCDSLGQTRCEALVAQFAADMQAFLADANSRSAGHRDRQDQIAREAHRLAAVAAVLGADRLSQHMLRLELVLRDGEDAAVARHFADTGSMWSELRAALERHEESRSDQHEDFESHAPGTSHAPLAPTGTETR